MIALAGLVCQLGDVVVLRDGHEEAWLTGALVLSDDRPIAALLFSSQAAVFARGGALYWLSPAEMPGARGGEPLHAIDHDGTTYRRVRRLPVRVDRIGTGAPTVGNRAILGEYSAVGLQCACVLAGAEAVLAWCGRRLGEGDYDVLPGGRRTLER